MENGECKEKGEEFVDAGGRGVQGESREEFVDAGDAEVKER